MKEQLLSADVDVVIAKVDNEKLALLASKLNGKTDTETIKSIFADEVKSLVAAGKVKEGEIKTFE